MLPLSEVHYFETANLTPAVRERLALWRAESIHTAPIDLVFCTRTGKKLSASNLRRDVLIPAIKAANVQLEMLGIAELGTVTFHSLRRTYASLRCICGDDARYTADQLGHTDPKFTFRVYAQASKRRAACPTAAQSLRRGPPMGTNGHGRRLRDADSLCA